MKSRLARVTIILLPSITCFDIASRLEHWPFSNYPMYSLVYTSRLSILRIYSVSETGETEIRDYGAFAPFDPARLTMALSRLAEQGKAQAALDELMHLYRKNHPSGPPIRGLRLYGVGWNLRPGLSGNEPPDERTLIASAR